MEKLPEAEHWTFPQFQAAFAACKTKGQALGCCIKMLSQEGTWSNIDADVYHNKVRPHVDAFDKFMGTGDEGADK